MHLLGDDQRIDSGVGADTRGDLHRGAEQVLVVVNGFARVQADANVQRLAAGDIERFDTAQDRATAGHR